ncbi:MAG TPA: hypothetical protein OIM45_08095 [Clostridiaceae bacterium]|nr:hypothetical protein [Clostridiaceae bacterium]
MNELKVGKKYTVKTENENIDFDYEVLEINNGQIAYKILENRSTNISMMREGTNVIFYDKASTFVKLSKELI